MARDYFDPYPSEEDIDGFDSIYPSPADLEGFESYQPSPAPPEDEFDFPLRPPGYQEPVQGFGDRLALSLGNVPQLPYTHRPGETGPSWLAHLVTGAARGFSGARGRAISERERLNKALAQKAHDENVAAAAATRAAKAGEASLGRAKELELFRRDLGPAPTAPTRIAREDVEAFPGLRAGDIGKAWTDTGVQARVGGQRPKEKEKAAPEGPKVSREDVAAFPTLTGADIGKPWSSPSVQARITGQRPTPPSEKLKAPTATEREKLAAGSTALTQQAAIQKLYKPEYVGPLSGVRGGVAAKVGKPLKFLGLGLRKGEADFKAALATYRNAAINVLTGTAAGVEEAKRLLQQIPQETDPSEVFEAKLRQTEENLRRVAEQYRGTLESTGVDLGQLAPLPVKGTFARGPDGKLVLVKQ